MKKKSKYPSPATKKSAAKVSEVGVRSGYAVSATNRKVKAPAKRATNLTLDQEAIARGERYSARMGTSLSKLVSGFLAALPLDDASDVQQPLTPVVRRLHGIASTAAAIDDREEYRGHLRRKYGER